jgi:hypothetical protein
MASAHGLELMTVRPFHVAVWIENFPGSKPTIKAKARYCLIRLALSLPCWRGYLWIQFMPVLLAVGIVAEGVFLFRSID